MSVPGQEEIRLGLRAKCAGGERGNWMGSEWAGRRPQETAGRQSGWRRLEGLPILAKSADPHE